MRASKTQAAAALRRNLGLACLLISVIFVPAKRACAQLPAGTSDASSSSQPQPLDPLRAQANVALDQRDYAAAIKPLTALVEKNPTDAHLLYDLASAEDALDQTTQAADSYQRAIAADATFFEPRLALGLLLARQHQYKQAHAQLDVAVTLTAPDDSLKARAYRALARLDQSGDPQSSTPPNPSAANSNLLAALKLSPESPDDIFLAAELAEASNDLPAAEASYRRLLAANPPGDPAAPAATAALAHILLRQNKAAEAESLLSAAVSTHPGDTILNAQLATLYMADANPAKSAQALPIIEKLHAAHPSDLNVTRILARLYAKHGDYAKAEPLFASIVTSSPQPDPTVIDDRADALIHLKRPAEAEALLQRALANPASFPSKEDLGIAAGHLAFAASQNNDPKATLQALSLRATVLPQSPSALFLAATAHDKLHEVKVASDLYKQFLTVANGKFPDEEWEARHRLVTLEHMK